MSPPPAKAEGFLASINTQYTKRNSIPGVTLKCQVESRHLRDYITVCQTRYECRVKNDCDVEKAVSLILRTYALRVI